MSELRQALAGYLDLRRGLGFKLDRDAKLLGQFISWLEDHGAVTITTADALAWVTLPAGASSSWLAFRMRAVRGFARYLRTLDPAAEVPPPGVLPGRIRRAVPQQQTCSIGYATWNTSETAEQLMHRVDQALYAAKHAGRNRTEAHSHTAHLRD